jgi:hypothetical protein
MKSIRKFAYATALMLSSLNFAPSLASAQDAAGTFTLTHEVYWQNAIVPSGEYRFTMGASGPSELLVLRNLSGNGASFMLRVTDTEASKTSDESQLVVVARSSRSYVSAMKLPASGLTLRFAVPETHEVARSAATSAISAIR